eukprot:1156421-Pelagomonas_calceolata.AAC.7
MQGFGKAALNRLSSTHLPKHTRKRSCPLMRISKCYRFPRPADRDAWHLQCYYEQQLELPRQSLIEHAACSMPVFKPQPCCAQLRR